MKRFLLISAVTAITVVGPVSANGAENPLVASLPAAPTIENKCNETGEKTTITAAATNNGALPVVNTIAGIAFANENVVSDMPAVNVGTILSGATVQFKFDAYLKAEPTDTSFVVAVSGIYGIESVLDSEGGMIKVVQNCGNSGGSDSSEQKSTQKVKISSLKGKTKKKEGSSKRDVTFKGETSNGCPNGSKLTVSAKKGEKTVKKKVKINKKKFEAKLSLKTGKYKVKANYSGSEKCTSAKKTIDYKVK